MSSSSTRCTVCVLYCAQHTDICGHALSQLEKSRVKRVVMVGRRGPLQASFTIKELREMTRLSHTSAVLHQRDFEQCQQILTGRHTHSHTHTHTHTHIHSHTHTYTHTHTHTHTHSLTHTHTHTYTHTHTHTHTHSHTHTLTHTHTHITQCSCSFIVQSYHDQEDDSLSL